MVQVDELLNKENYLLSGLLSISKGNSNTASAVKINVLLFICIPAFISHLKGI